MCPILQKKQSKRAGQLKKKHPARNSETTQTGKPLFLYKDVIDRHRHSKPWARPILVLGTAKKQRSPAEAIAFRGEVGNWKTIQWHRPEWIQDKKQILSARFSTSFFLARLHAWWHIVVHVACSMCRLLADAWLHMMWSYMSLETWACRNPWPYYMPGPWAYIIPGAL